MKTQTLNSIHWWLSTIVLIQIFPEEKQKEKYWLQISRKVFKLIKIVTIRIKC